MYELHHKNKLAHLDLKLDNVMISDSLGLKLIDFCFAKNINQTLDYSIGTEFFKPPEMRVDESVMKPYSLEKADIFCLGICFFSILFERQPYKQTDMTCPFFSDLMREEHLEFISKHKIKRIQLR